MKEDNSCVIMTEDGTVISICGEDIEKSTNDNSLYLTEIVEIPILYKSLDDFVSSTEIEEVSKPYPNEHSCPHAAPSRFDSFRRSTRKHEGKPYSVLYGRAKGTNRWEEASYRYPKDSWSAEEASAHCKSHDGIAFEAAKKSIDAEEAANEKDSVKSYIVKKDSERNLVYGIVLEPNKVDLQADFENCAEIEKAAHRYMAHVIKNKLAGIGSEHVAEIEKAVPVESFVAPTDFWYDGTPHTDEYKVSKGSWVLVTHVGDGEEFAKVKGGGYTGYSVQGIGRRKYVKE